MTPDAAQDQPRPWTIPAWLRRLTLSDLTERLRQLEQEAEQAEQRRDETQER